MATLRSGSQRLRAAAVLALFALILVHCSCSPSSAPTVVVAPKAAAKEEAADLPPFFEEVTAKAGIDFTYRNGEEAGHFVIIESLGGGVALLDFDGDGRLDIFFPGGGQYSKKADEYVEFQNGQPVVHEGKYTVKSPAPEVRGRPCRLYRNLGGWKFQDVTAEAGLDIPFQFTHGAFAFDFDRDGWPDLLVTGYDRLKLLHNEPAPGGKGRRFVDVTEKAGLKERLWSSGAAFGDLDGDGYPDLYVSHYGDWGFGVNHPWCSYDSKTQDVCQPRKFTPLQHTVYRNRGDGTFEDVTATLKLRKHDPAAKDPGGKGMQPIITDLNGDGRPDVYVANDTDDNFLYLNKSKPGAIVLEEVGLFSGVARDERGQANGSMGVDVADYNRSEKPSILVTNYENELPALYQNISDKGRPSFNYATVMSGMGAAGGNYVGWGVGFADVDNHGWDDAIMVNGHAIRFPAAKFGRRQKPELFRNHQGRFKLTTDQGGEYFRSLHNARGLALGDLDNDGKIDLVVSHLNEPVAVLRNVSAGTNHWLGLSLVGKDRRDVIGARVVVESAAGTQTHFAKGGGSFASSRDPRHVFGLGADTEVSRIRVYWPWGQTQEWTGPKIDGYWRLTEGQKDATPEPAPR